MTEWQARGAVVRTAAGELALGLPSGRVHLEAVTIDPRQAVPAPRSQARCHSPLAGRTRKRRQQLARPSASRPKAPLASGGYIRRIPVTGVPRRLLGRSPIERSTPELACRLPMARSATLLPLTVTKVRCCHRQWDRSPGVVGQPLPASPTSAWLPDRSGRLSACAVPGASVLTLYLSVSGCQ